MLNPAEVSLVQKSFAKVAPIAPQAAKLFYSRLFEIAPCVAPLFTSNMDDQGVKLMSSLGTVVDGLNAPDEILPFATALAHRHVGYGVQSRHYAHVGEALLWTLEEGLGPEFDADTKAAWMAAYDMLSDAMITAAYPKKHTEILRMVKNGEHAAS
ncbi:MAG: globin family protein [Pseudomonadota bacterium]